MSVGFVLLFVIASILVMAFVLDRIIEKFGLAHRSLMDDTTLYLNRLYGSERFIAVDTEGGNSKIIDRHEDYYDGYHEVTASIAK